jgi:hypothetical protein
LASTTRKRMWHLVRDVEQHLEVNGPWPYVLSDLYYMPEVTAAGQARIGAETPTRGDLTTGRWSVRMSCGPI